MHKSNINTPLSDLKEEKITSNFDNSDQSESSTGDSNPNGDFSKNKEIFIASDKKNTRIKKIEKVYKKDITKNKKLLNKKTKRNNSKYLKKDNIINIIFNEFKNTSSLYKKFPQFNIIEKNIKNDLYSSSHDLARDVRNIFSNIFSSFSKKLDYSKYNQVLIYSEYFEKIFAKYDCDSIAKKANHLFEEINKLKKEIHKYENDKIGKISGKSKKNEKNTEISVKKYKENISNKINKLNVEQKKRILNIISNNLLDKNDRNNIIEFNINKIPYNQLKELNKYINECINNSILISQFAKNCENSGNDTFEERKENSLSVEDNSSFFSEDDYEDDDLE